MTEQIINIKSKAALGVDGKMYEILCDIKHEDGRIEENQTAYITEAKFQEYISQRRQEAGKSPTV